MSTSVKNAKHLEALWLNISNTIAQLRRFYPITYILGKFEIGLIEELRQNPKIISKEFYTKNIVDINQVFLRKQDTKFSSGFIGDNTASFNAITASAPAPLTSTTEHDFIFFINGQYMEHDAISIQQNGSSFHLQVDTDSIGYVLESDDEIMVSGKFNS